MNINKLLCKHMDYGDKGHVTLWDIVKGTVYISAFATVTTVCAISSVYMYLHGAALVIQGSLQSGDVVSCDDMLCIALFMGITIIGILVVAAIVAQKLASIRVVTCERKDGDD